MLQQEPVKFTTRHPEARPNGSARSADRWQARRAPPV